MLAENWLFATALANRLEKYESLNRADIAEAFNDVAMVYGAPKQTPIALADRR
jgi:hypothetical protein